MNDTQFMIAQSALLHTQDQVYRYLQTRDKPYVLYHFQYLGFQLFVLLQDRDALLMKSIDRCQDTAEKFIFNMN
jgi:hypothetical protein